MFYVYAYCDPRTKLPFYIGKGQVHKRRGRGRINAHLTRCQCTSIPDYNYPFYRKLRKMLREGIEPQVVKVFEGGERACLQVEETLIQSYGLRVGGGLLSNVCKGGQGVSGRRPSDKAIAALVKYNKGREVPTRAIDPSTGEVAHEFANHSEAVNAGFSQRAISNVLHGWAKTYKGLYWEATR